MVLTYLFYVALTTWSFMVLVSVFAATALYLEGRAWRATFLFGVGFPAWLVVCAAVGAMRGAVQCAREWWAEVSEALSGV